jgi:hypothetical protein
MATKNTASTVVKKAARKGTTQRTAFPPSALADLSSSSASNYLKLVRVLKNENCVLGLGAGVSVSAGIPEWGALLNRIASAFFEHWPDAKASPPRNLSIGLAHQQYHSPDAIAAGKTLACGDPLLVAQQIKNCLRDVDWVWLVRRALYDKPDGGPHSGKPSPLIEALCRLCACDESLVSEVITYNYDDLLERCLSQHGICNSPVAFGSIKSTTKGIHVYHPHGFLPLGGGPENNRFVLADSDYHEHIAAPHSWSNLIQLHAFARYTAVFVGASLRDPALRRTLRLARITHERPHFAFLPCTEPGTTETEKFDALFDLDIRGLGVHSIRYKPINNHYILTELVDNLIASVRSESGVSAQTALASGG